MFWLEESTEIIQIQDAKWGVSKKNQNCKVTKHKQKEWVVLEIQDPTNKNNTFTVNLNSKQIPNKKKDKVR